MRLRTVLAEIERADAQRVLEAVLVRHPYDTDALAAAAI